MVAVYAQDAVLGTEQVLFFLGKWATMKTVWLWHIESVFSVLDANVVNEERKYTTDLSVFYQGFGV